MKIITSFIRFITPLSALVTASFIIASFSLLAINTTLPDSNSIRSIELKIPLRVFSADKQLIAEFGNERRKPISIANTPSILIKAILASEDDDFFNHKGIDLPGLIRATLANFRSGEHQQGASTITMQVARNFFLSREKTYTRKLKEILLAIKLEQILNKHEILSLYLNKIFLGHRAYGFGAAAEVYYGKPLSKLNVAELAMLAGLPKAPSSNNPLRNPQRAVQRRNYVLNRMLNLRLLTEQQHATASNAPVTAQKHTKETPVSAPHIAEMVRAHIIEEYGEQGYWQGLSVFTTIEADKQAAATMALREGLERYDRKHGFRGSVGRIEPDSPDGILKQFPNSGEHIPAAIIHVDQQTATAVTKNDQQVTLELTHTTWARKHLTVNTLGPTPKSMKEILNVGDIVYIKPIDSTTKEIISSWQLSQIPNISGALVSVDSHSGNILSLVGGYDFFLNKYNRATQSVRQPGSNIKPFIYSASLNKGFSPASMISGAPIVIKNQAHGTVWRPENYSGKFFGPTRMREALAKSMNLVSIRLLRAIGTPYTMEYLKRFNVNTERFVPSLTLALGSGGITPLEMLGAYTVLANGGYQVKPKFIDYITDRNNEVVFKSKQPNYCNSCYDELYAALDNEQQVEETSIEEEGIIENDDITEVEAIKSNADNPIDETNSLTYQAPRVMSVNNHFLLTSMLKEVIRSGTARKALALNRQDLAGKTGTTNDYVDAWFSGFNSKVATTVWVGFDKPRSIGKGEAGSVVALPIWVDYMRTALKEIPEDTVNIPNTISTQWINKTTGQISSVDDPYAIEEYVALSAQRTKTQGNAAVNTDADSEQFPKEITPLPTENRLRIIEKMSDTDGLF